MNIYVSEFKPKKADYILASRWCLDQNQNHIPILAYNFTEYSNTAEYAIGDIVRASVAAFGWAFYKARRAGTLSAPQNHTTADWEFIEMVYPTIPAGKIFKLPANPDDYADHDLYFTNKTAIETFGKGMFMDPGQPYLKTPAYDGDEYVSPSWGAYNIAIPYGLTGDDSHWAPLIGEKAQMTFDQAPTSRLPDAKMNESLWVNTYKPADGEYFTCETPYKQIPVGICTDYISLVWNDKLYETGDFQLTLIDTPDNRKLFKNGRWIQIPNSDRVMIIEKIEFNAALKSDGYLMNVSGRGLSSILDRRVSFPGLSLNTSECTKDGGFVYGIERLVEAYFIDPTIPIATNNLNQNPDFYYPERHISCLKIGRNYHDQFPDLNPTAGTNNVPHTSINKTVSNELVLDTVQNSCKKNNIGFRMDIEHDDVYDCDWLVFKLYQGQKRLYNTDHPLVFSSKMNNVDSVAVTTDSTEYKNFFFCGKEKDANTYIDFTAVQTLDPSNLIGDLISKSKAVTSITNWIKTNLQNNNITRTAVMFMAVAACRADNGGDQTIIKIEQGNYQGQWTDDFPRDPDGQYAYPTKIISGLYRITFKKIVGGSSSNPDGYLYTDDCDDTPNGWIESFKESTAFGWLTTDFLKEAKAQAKAKLATSVIGVAQYGAMLAWFSNLDRYTATYSQVKWLCGTHFTGEPGCEGLDRREQFVDEEAEDDKDWDTSDIMSWKQQTNIVKVGEDKSEESDEDIVKRLTASAIKQSGQYRQKHEVDAKCNGDVTKYRVDYNLGDVVQVDDEHGVIESYMITGVAVTNDVSKGEQAIPSFEKYSRIPSNYTELEYLSVSNMILPVVYNPRPSVNTSVDTEDVKNKKTDFKWLPSGNDDHREYFGSDAWKTGDRILSISGYKDREFVVSDFSFETDHVLNAINRQKAHYVAPDGILKTAIISADGYEKSNIARSTERDFPLLLVRDFYEYAGRENNKSQLHATGFMKDGITMGEVVTPGLSMDIGPFAKDHVYTQGECCYINGCYWKFKEAQSGSYTRWEDAQPHFDPVGTANTVSAICGAIIRESYNSSGTLQWRNTAPGFGYSSELAPNGVDFGSGFVPVYSDSNSYGGRFGIIGNSHAMLYRTPFKNKIYIENLMILANFGSAQADRPQIFNYYWTSDGLKNDPANAVYAGDFSGINDLIKLFKNYIGFSVYESGKSYNAGDQVYIRDQTTGQPAYYMSLVDDNVGHHPSSSDNYWKPAEKYIICRYTGSASLLGYTVNDLVGTLDEPTDARTNRNFFIDIKNDTLGLSDSQKREYLEALCQQQNPDGSYANRGKTVAIITGDGGTYELYRIYETPEYQSDIEYNYGSNVVYNGEHYVYAPTSRGVAPYSSSNAGWVGVGVSDSATEYDSDTEYNIGDIVIYDGQYYQFKYPTSRGVPPSTPGSGWLYIDSSPLTYGLIPQFVNAPGTIDDTWPVYNTISEINGAVESYVTFFQGQVNPGDMICMRCGRTMYDPVYGNNVVKAYVSSCLYRDNTDRKLTDAALSNMLVRTATNGVVAEFTPQVPGSGLAQNTENIATMWLRSITGDASAICNSEKKYLDVCPGGTYFQEGVANDRYFVLAGYRYRRDFGDDAYDYVFDPKFTDNENGYAFKTLKFYETRGVDRKYTIMGCDFDEILTNGSQKVDPNVVPFELRAQIIDPSSRKQTHEFVPVKYNGADGDDYANLRDVDKYGFYDVDEQRFIPINFSPDGTENRAAKFCSAGPELVQNT